MFSALPAVASVLVSFCALVLSLVSFRATLRRHSIEDSERDRRYAVEDAERSKVEAERELRKADVLAWANKSIYQFQSLELTLLMSPSDAGERYLEIAFQTSSLNEMGRLLFRNAHPDFYGLEKFPAYRGFRPIIFDQLIIAHQIACRSADADDETIRRFHSLARRALQQFVSLAQDEVGRGRTAAQSNESAGSGIEVERMAAQVKEEDMFPRGRRYL